MNFQKQKNYRDRKQKFESEKEKEKKARKKKYDKLRNLNKKAEQLQERINMVVLEEQNVGQQIHGKRGKLRRLKVVRSCVERELQSVQAQKDELMKQS
jgi:hypothetical protein